MKKNVPYRVLVWLLAALTLAAAVCPALAAGTVCGQTHATAKYLKNNAVYANKYFEGCGRALDGSDGLPDLCIPGLSEEDNMVPQGIAYYAAKDQMLISAYSKSGGESLIFALDMKDGHLAAEYHLYRVSGSLMKAHVGGIAVSGRNLYLADNDSKISYAPLSALNAEDGTAADLTLAGTADCAAYLNGANTSYVGCSDGLLWTGNFYKESEESYNKKAASDCASLIVCFELGGDSSESEWASLTPDGSSFAEPAYSLRVPDSIDRIQGVYLKGDTAYLSTSYGMNSPGKLYTARVDREGGRLLGDGYKRTDSIPAMEDLANYFRTGSGKNADIVDTVWEVDTDRLAALQANPAGLALNRIVLWFRRLVGMIRAIF